MTWYKSSSAMHNQCVVFTQVDFGPWEGFKTENGQVLLPNSETDSSSVVCDCWCFWSLDPSAELTLKPIWLHCTATKIGPFFIEKNLFLADASACCQYKRYQIFPQNVTECQICHFPVLLLDCLLSVVPRSRFAAKSRPTSMCGATDAVNC